MSSMPSLGSATVRVEKATSDLLIGPDWTLNMDICDSINSDHWQAKDVVKAVKKRLQHKNPRVQFLALTLLETMIKNCGDFVHHQVVERDILQEMLKIVRKKTDMEVRNKILVLLDSWQEAFGGPGGKYPQYYWAYAELKRSGVVFPQRSADSALIFTPPVTHPTSIPRHPQANYGMPSNSTMRLDEAMASEMANLSLSDLDRMRSALELLAEMLRAVNPNDREAVKDEVIVDLVTQCRSNQRRLMLMVNSTGDEELLGQGLGLNDNLQSVLAKYDAILAGSPLPEEPKALPEPAGPIVSEAPSPLVGNQYEDEEEDDDEFSQLARRNSKFTQKVDPETGNQESSMSHSDVTNVIAASTASEASSSVASNVLALPDPPAPVRTTELQNMIDLLSITLSTNPSLPHTPLTPPSTSADGGSPLSVRPNGQGYPYNPQTYTGNQGFNPYNNYVAPWARSVPSHPQPQSSSPPQPQVAQYSSSYPPPPWAAPVSSSPNPFTSTGYQVPAVPVTAAAPYVPTQAARQMQQYNNSFGSNVKKVPATTGEGGQVNANQRVAGSGVSPKPYVPTYRLFEDLIELRNADGSLKVSGATPASGTSSQGMIGGKK